ncbi:hypothetical protein M0R45_011780 [Rubus argutus]|uniref:Uncharacterized protein n=1 Tax=Rubus argutus TaxID=59490 RepID=A0AAW1YC81_RUBAR
MCAPQTHVLGRSARTKDAKANVLEHAREKNISSSRIKSHPTPVVSVRFKLVLNSLSFSNNPRVDLPLGLESQTRKTHASSLVLVRSARAAPKYPRARYKYHHYGPFTLPLAFVNLSLPLHIKNPRFTEQKKASHFPTKTMAGSKAPVMALMAVFVIVISLAGAAQAAEAPAPSPTSPAASISPSFISACIAAATALVFGSALRV